MSALGGVARRRRLRTGSAIFRDPFLIPHTGFGHLFVLLRGAAACADRTDQHTVLVHRHRALAHDEVPALPRAIYGVRHEAPSLRNIAIGSPRSSVTVTLIFRPISASAVLQPSRIRSASSSANLLTEATSHRSGMSLRTTRAITVNECRAVIVESVWNGCQRSEDTVSVIGLPVGPY